jgi:HlyD family secretion protein
LAAVTTRAANNEEAEMNDQENNDDNVTLNVEMDEVVFRFEDGVAKKVKVKTGISDFERIEILSGLEQDDKVISGPFLAVSKRLKDGDLVMDTSGADKEDSDESTGEEESN